jgi:hypothetical protein
MFQTVRVILRGSFTLTVLVYYYFILRCIRRQRAKKYNLRRKLLDTVLYCRRSVLLDIKKEKLSRYTPWRRLGREVCIAPTHS